MLSEGLVTLRVLQDTDTIPMAALLNNKRIVDNLRDRVPFPYTEEDAAMFISFMKDQQPVRTFGIDYKNEFCGVISLEAQQDVYRKGAEIGYWLGEPFWGKGIMSVAVKLASAYGFEQLDLARLFSGIFEYNPASMKVLEKNGYKQEGVFEKSIFKNGQLWNEHRYAKIK